MKLLTETQFIKNHCHPHLSTIDLGNSSLKNNENRLHPLYDFEADKEIAKQLYKLKGFAYLRSDVLHPNSDLSASRALLKSAKSFQKA